MKIDMLPRCDELDADGFDDCGAPAVVRVEDPQRGLNEAYMCEQHFKEHVWDECQREARKNLASNSKDGRIKLRLRDLS